MNSDSKIKKLIASVKSKKHIEIIVAVAAVVIMLIIYFSAKITPTRKTKSTSTANTANNYCSQTEASLTSALKEMKGVGNVRVVINWESGVETVIAYATNISGNSTVSTPTLIQSQGSSSPIVLKELYPKALGVIIICQGGNDVAVKLDVINAVSVLLNIPQNKVNVYAMK